MNKKSDAIHILIVDDDQHLCEALTEEFTYHGYKTDSVHNADDAIDFLRKTLPDVILLDLKMPGKNGFDVLREMNENKHNVHIIVLTAYADVRSAIEAAKLGASDFISKPYNFDELLQAVEKLINTRTK